MRRAFTLVEILVVLAILAVLVGLAIPAVQAVREVANRSRCKNNLRQIALATHLYHDARQTLPAYLGTLGNGQAGWYAHLLPYLDNQPLFTKIGAGNIWTSGVPEVRHPLLQCPSDSSSRVPGLVYDRWGSTNYLANWNAFSDSTGTGSNTEGPWSQQGYLAPPPPITHLTDGLSNTILFAEGYAWCDDIGRIALYSWHYHNFGLTGRLQAGQLGDNLPAADYPRGLPNTWMFQVQPKAMISWQCPPGVECCDKRTVQTPHKVMHTALADGSIRQLAPGISQQTWTSLLLPRDGGIVGSD